MTNRTRLSDILNTAGRSLADAWESTQAAGDFTPLPAGNYTARIIEGKLDVSRSGTPGYRLTFKIIEGEHAGRQVWHDLWLTPAALPMSKRDLSKLGVTRLEQLESPLPQGIRCAVHVALRRDDDGTERNRVKRFEVLGVDDDPHADADFAPASPSPAPLATHTQPSLIDDATAPAAPARSAMTRGA